MKEIRDIKIDMLTGSQNPIIELFNQITEGIQIVNCDVYHKHGWEFIYFVPAKTAEQYSADAETALPYHKDGEWIFYQNLKNEKFWCNYYKYWSFFESQLGLTYVEVQAITKLLVEEALKREVVPPCSYVYGHVCRVEEALKREVVPPTCEYFNKFISKVEEALKREVPPVGVTYDYTGAVEEALKREVATPIRRNNCDAIMVEEALKREVVPPHFPEDSYSIMVEEALKRETK